MQIPALMRKSYVEHSKKMTAYKESKPRSKGFADAIKKIDSEKSKDDNLGRIIDTYI